MQLALHTKLEGHQIAASWTAIKTADIIIVCAGRYYKLINLL
jgi:hypothetical protein